MIDYLKKTLHQKEVSDSTKPEQVHLGLRIPQRGVTRKVCLDRTTHREDGHVYVVIYLGLFSY